MSQIAQQLVDINIDSNRVKDNRPALTTWKGVPMVRTHSLLVTVKEMIQMMNSLDVIKIGIIGEPSTGKTTLAMTLAHLIHTLSPIPFAFKVLDEDDFLDMTATLKRLDATNYILYFHDLSFLTNKKKLEEVKATITKIRHLQSDVKIVLIYDYHYTLGLDKYLRQANFRFYTSIGSSEFDNMIKTLGTKYTGLITDFNRKYVEMTTKQTCTFKVRDKPLFTYNYKNPFIVCLFWNNARPRYVIFPKREWIEKTCSKCVTAMSDNPVSQIPIAQFKAESDKKWGSAIKTALKLHLLIHGVNSYNPKVVQAYRYLEKAMVTKYINLEELAVAYDLKPTKTYMKKKLDGVLAT